MKGVCIRYVPFIFSISILVYTILVGNQPIIYHDLELGFASQIPPIYYIGFILLLSSFGYFWIHQSNPSSKWCLLFLFLLVGYWNVYIFVQPAPMRPDAYLHFSEVFRLIEEGRIDVVRYGIGGWPGLFIFGDILFSVTGLPPLLFLQFYPLITSSVFVFAVYLLAKRLFESKILALTSATLALFGNIGLQYIFTPHSLAAALFPFSFLVFFAKKRTNTLFFILTYIAIVMTYGLFPMFFAVLLLSIGVLFLLNKKRALFLSVSITHVTILLIVSILLTYMNFKAQFGLERAAYTLKVFFARPPTISTYMEEAASDIVFPFLALIRSGVLYIFVIVAILATIYLLKNMIKRDLGKYSFLLLANMLSLVLLLLSPYFHFSLPNIRAWYLIVLSSSLSAPIVISGIRRIKIGMRFIKYYFPVFIIFICITGFIAFHAYDTYLVPPISELKGTYFISKHWDASVVYDNRYPGLQIEFYRPQDSFEHRSFFALENASLLESELLVIKYTSYSFYFINNRIDEYNRIMQNLNNVSYGNRIYDSSTLKAFTGCRRS